MACLIREDFATVVPGFVLGRWQNHGGYDGDYNLSIFRVLPYDSYKTPIFVCCHNVIPVLGIPIALR